MRPPACITSGSWADACHKVFSACSQVRTDDLDVLPAGECMNSFAGESIKLEGTTINKSWGTGSKQLLASARAACVGSPGSFQTCHRIAKRGVATSVVGVE